MVRFRTMNGPRLGVASTWLDRIAQPMTGGEGGADTPSSHGPLRVPIFLKKWVWVVWWCLAAGPSPCSCFVLPLAPIACCYPCPSC